MRACVFNKLAMCAVAALVAFGLRADSARTAAKDGAGVKHYGYWLHGKNMKDVDLGLLSSSGATDIFLHEYAVTKHGLSEVESWIAKANAAGIKIHIWTQVFYNGGWINPVKDGTLDAELFDERIGRAKRSAQIKGVAGIHFDYLRYPGTAYKTAGGTGAVSEFARRAAAQLHQVNSNLVVSVALMPETISSEHYYGQDYAAISKYMDVVIPMIYKGNYKKESPWIAATAKWYVENSKGAKVWAGLQGYKSDEDTAPLPASEIAADAELSFEAGSDGVVIFRWGVTNLIARKKTGGD